MSVCQFYTTPTAEQAATYKVADPDVVLGCKDPVGGDGALHCFVPVPGGAVRVAVCDRHGDELARHYTPGGTG